MGARSPQIGGNRAGDQPLTRSAFPTLTQPYTFPQQRIGKSALFTR
jgi:hypothetical protein